MNNNKLFELFIPTGKLHIKKNNIVDNFRVNSVESISEDLYVESNSIYSFIFCVVIENKFKFENIRYLELIRIYCRKNNISKNVQLDSNKDFLIEIEFISYNYLIHRNFNKLICKNIDSLITEIYNAYKEDIDNILSISNSKDNFLFLYKLLKTNLFKKLEINVEEFLYIFNITNVNKDNLDIKLSLVKTIDIRESHLLNINISGASDLLDIKKDVVFIINNLEKYFNIIIEFFDKYDMDYNNILASRLKKLIDIRILNIYEFFKIKLSVKNLILLLKLCGDKENITKIVRVFKFIKSLSLNIVNEEIISKSIKLSNIDIDYFIHKLDNVRIKDTALEFQTNFVLSFKLFLQIKCENFYKIDDIV